MNADQLRKALKELPGLGPSSGLPRFTWERRRAELPERVKGDDLSRFLTWPMMAEAFFVGDAPWVQHELKALQEDDWERWQNGIKEVEFGAPARLEAHEDSSGQMVHQAYILKQWEDAAEKKVGQLQQVFEFGGGYGSMARLCRQLGFRGAYAIHDLPEFLLLQRFYLSQTGVPNVAFIENYEPLMGMTFDLFIAACSLSEVPFEVRDKVLDTIPARGYVILYQQDYMGRDNHSYFYEFAQTRPQLVWKNYQVKHWPTHWYLVGT